MVDLWPLGLTVFVVLTALAGWRGRRNLALVMVAGSMFCAWFGAVDLVRDAGLHGGSVYLAAGGVLVLLALVGFLWHLVARRDSRGTVSEERD